MILFFSKIKFKKNEIEGMAQRVFQIDELFKNKLKVYVNYQETEKSNFLLNIQKFHIVNLKTIQITLDYRKKQIAHILKLLVRLSKLVYFHSIYNVNTNLINILRGVEDKKIIVDFHGVVPEELKFQGKDELFDIYEKREKELVRMSDYFVTVSKNMKAFYVNKYNLPEDNFIIIPNFREKSIKVNTKKSKGKVLRIIYSGGAQIWQNVNLMMNFIKKKRTIYKFEIYTRDKSSFQEFVDGCNLNKYVVIKSVEKDELMKNYKSADLGFVLRDKNLINDVACPTKLIEYMLFGIVPIVKQPFIGDFKEIGYEYILIDELNNIRGPEDLNLREKRTNNYRKIKEIFEITKRGEKRLYDLY